MIRLVCRKCVMANGRWSGTIAYYHVIFDLPLSRRNKLRLFRQGVSFSLLFAAYGEKALSSQRVLDCSELHRAGHWS